MLWFKSKAKKEDASSETFWFNGKKVKKEEIPPEVLAHRDKFQAIVEPLLRLEPVREYNDLIPPSNPLYPWKADGWEVLCYYCHVCGVRTPPHGGFCSVGGPPSFHATPMSQKESEVTRWAEAERGKEMHIALFDLLQVYEGKPSYQREGLSLNEAVRHVLKASPWGHSVK